MDIKSNDKFMMSIRQYENINDENSMINVFPILIDKSLERYADTLRTFLVVSLISQIKVNNALKITNIATSSFTPTGGGENVADRIQSALGFSAPDNDRFTRIDLEREQFNRQRSDQNKYEYQDKINQLLVFIKNQIQYDPQFIDFNPMISSITTENLLQVPLIIGTKKYSLDTEVHYWMLFVSLATSTPLDSPGNLSKIKRFMRMIPNDRYIDLFKIRSDFKFPPFITNPQNTPLMNKFITNSQTNLDKVLNLMNDVLNEKKWNEEVGFNTASSLKISTALTQTMAKRQQLQNSASSVLRSFMLNLVIDKINSILNTIIGSQDIDIPRITSELAQEVLSTCDIYMEKIMNALIASLESTHESEEGENMINIIKGSCESVGKIGVVGVLKNLQAANFRLIPNEPISIAFINFVENLMRPVPQMRTVTSDIDKKMIDIGSFTESSIQNIINEFRESLWKIYYGFLTRRDIGLVEYVLQLDGSMKAQQTPNPSLMSRFNFVTGASGGSSSNIIKYIESMSSGLQEYTFFLTQYSIMSYFCEYMKEVEVNVEVQKQNATSFPHYSLVVPIEFATGLYTALASYSFKELIERGNEIDNKLNIKNTSTKHMLKVLNERLKIPNIFIVDRKSGKVTYKLKYMKDTVEISLSSVDAYIKHQSNVLSGF
jgi:hypothetical protein